MLDKLEENQEKRMESTLSGAPFSSKHFNETIQSEIHQKLKNRLKLKKRTFYNRAITAAVTLLVVAIFMVFISPEIKQTTKGVGEWEVRRTYIKDGIELFTVMEDPFLEAGKKTGYLISFKAPFSQFSGKSLEIDAIHRETGLKVIANPAHVITEPSGGYTSLGRYGFFTGLPLSGEWRYEVKLNGEFYGDAVLNVDEPTWAISPVFKSGVYQMRGIEKNFGFIDNLGFTAGKSNKYMWHFWGEDKKKLSGPFTVTAVKKDSNEIINVFSAPSLGGALNGADRNVVSAMSLPTVGLWRLMAYVNDQMIGSVVVEVSR